MSTTETIQEQDGILAWHFLRPDRRLRYKDNQPCELGEGDLVEEGKTLSYDGELELCRSGMHGSIKVLDALQYVPGYVVSRVKLWGSVVRSDDKIVASHRTCLWILDQEDVMHEFACWCAEQSFEIQRKAGKEPDPRSIAAVEAKRKWLRKEITDTELEAARSAAWSAESAARSAQSAAWSAESAARSVAQSAAWSAARSAQNEELERLLSAAYERLQSS